MWSDLWLKKIPLAIWEDGHRGQRDWERQREARAARWWERLAPRAGQLWEGWPDLESRMNQTGQWLPWGWKGRRGTPDGSQVWGPEQPAGCSCHFLRPGGGGSEWSEVDVKCKVSRARRMWPARWGSGGVGVEVQRDTSIPRGIYSLGAGTRKENGKETGTKAWALCPLAFKGPKSDNVAAVEETWAMSCFKRKEWAAGPLVGDGEGKIKTEPMASFDERGHWWQGKSHF